MRLRGSMTFEQIGEREGVTGARAWQIYRTALRKIQRRHRQGELVRLLILHRARIERSERITVV